MTETLLPMVVPRRDGDPEWVENLNSVLDDNELLTLPNGERLALPPNTRTPVQTPTQTPPRRHRPPFGDCCCAPC